MTTLTAFREAMTDAYCDRHGLSPTKIQEFYTAGLLVDNSATPKITYKGWVAIIHDLAPDSEVMRLLRLTPEEYRTTMVDVMEMS